MDQVKLEVNGRNANVENKKMISHREGFISLNLTSDIEAVYKSSQPVYRPDFRVSSVANETVEALKKTNNNKEDNVKKQKVDQFYNEYKNKLVLNRRFNSIFSHKLYIYMINILSLLSFVATCLNNEQDKDLFTKEYIWFYLVNVIYLLYVVGSVTDIVVRIKIGGFGNEKMPELAFKRNKWNVFSLVQLVAHVVILLVNITDRFYMPFSTLAYKKFVIYSFSMIFVKIVAALVIFTIFRHKDHQLNRVVNKNNAIKFMLVLLISAYITLILSIIGVKLIGSLKYQCYDVAARKDDVYAFTIEPMVCNSDYKFASEKTCPRYSDAHKFQCVDTEEVLGLSRQEFYFENVFHGFLRIYGISTQNDWSGNLIEGLSGSTFYIDLFYYILVVYLIAWVLKNIFISVTADSIKGLELCSKTIEKIEYKLTSVALRNRRGVFSIEDKFPNGDGNIEFENKLSKKIKNTLKNAVYSKFYVLFVNVVLIADIFVVSVFPSITYKWELAVTSVFLLELAVILYTSTVKQFFTNSSNILVLGILVLSYISCLLQTFGVYYLEWIFAIRLVRIIYMNKSIYVYVLRIIGPINVFVQSIVYSSGLLLLLSCITCQIFSLNVNDPTVPIIGGIFDNIKFIFSIFVQDGNQALIFGIANNFGGDLIVLKYLVVLYLIGCHFMTAVIMTNVFISVILGNLELKTDEIIERQKVYTVELENIGESDNTKTAGAQAGESSLVQKKDKFEISIDSNFTFENLIPINLRVYNIFPEHPIILNSFSYKITTLTAASILFNEQAAPEQNLQYPIVPKYYVDFYLSAKFIANIEHFILKNYTESKDSQFFMKVFIFDSENKNDYLGRITYKHKLLSLKSYLINSALYSLEENQESNAQDNLIVPVFSPLIENKSRDTEASTVAKNITETDENDDEKNNNATGASGFQDGNVGKLLLKISQLKKLRAKYFLNLTNMHPQIEYTMFLFSKENRLRLACTRLLERRLTRDTMFARFKHMPIYIKKTLKFINTKSVFDWLELLFHIVSFVQMLFETPTNTVYDSPTFTIIEVVYLLFNFLHLILKFISYGVYFTSNSLLKSFPGVFSLLIFIFGGLLNFSLHFKFIFNKYVTFILHRLGYMKNSSLSDLDSFFVYKQKNLINSPLVQSVRTVRCLRPLLLVFLIQPLYNVIELLVSGWRNILKAMVIFVVYISVFAYINKTLFDSSSINKFYNSEIGGQNTQLSGVFYAQIDNNLPLLLTTETTNNNVTMPFNDTLPAILVPVAQVESKLARFSNFFYSFLSFFLLLTLDNWGKITSALYNYFEGKPLAFLIYPYVFAYIFFGSLLIVNIFIGVIVQNFNEKLGTALLSDEQKSWEDVKKRIHLTKPILLPVLKVKSEKTAKIYTKLFSFIMSKYFNMAESSVILLMSIFFSFTSNWTFQQSTSSTSYHLLLVQMAFLTILLLFQVVKIVTLSLLQYFKFYKLDFTLLMLLFMFVSIRHLQFVTKTNGHPNFAGVNLIDSMPSALQLTLNIFELAIVVAYLILVLYKWPVIEAVFRTILLCLQQSMYVLVVFVLFCFTYAIIGVVNFGLTRLNLYTNKYQNFQTAYNALVTLFIAATGDGWTNIFSDFTYTYPFCTDENKFNMFSECGSFGVAVVFFVSYLIVVSYIFLNLLIAMILSNFSLFAVSEEGAGHILPSDIVYIKSMWYSVDPQAKDEVNLDTAKILLKEYYDNKFYKKITPNYFKYILMDMELTVAVEGVTKALYARENNCEILQIKRKDHINQFEGSKKRLKINLNKFITVVALNSIDPDIHMMANEKIKRKQIESRIKERMAIEIIISFLYTTFEIIKKKNKSNNTLDTLQVNNSFEPASDTTSLNSIDMKKEVRHDFTTDRNNVSDIEILHNLSSQNQTILENFADPYYNSDIVQNERAKFVSWFGAQT